MFTVEWFGGVVSKSFFGFLGAVLIVDTRFQIFWRVVTHAHCIRRDNLADIDTCLLSTKRVFHVKKDSNRIPVEGTRR